MKASNLIAVCLFILASVASCSSSDMNKNTQEMATSHGYPCENYTIITPDGYVLRIFRILGHKNEDIEKARKQHKRPVLLQHGMLDSSDAFVLNESPALAYMLADKDYDVWIGNFRGNKYSRKHVKLNADTDENYWDFSIDELITYDLKTIFSFVLKMTRYEKISYMGHSMGCGSLLAAATIEPKFYSAHLQSFVSFAPSTRSLYSSDILRIARETQILDTLEYLGVNEIFSPDKFPHEALSKICSTIPIACRLLMKFTCDKTPEYDNVNKYEVLFNHFPAGTSMHVMKHLLQQSANNGYFKFRRNSGDRLVEYDFTKFPEGIPLALYMGTSDTLVTINDTRWLKQKLGKAVKEYKEYEGYGHLTFLVPGKYYGPFNDALAFLNKH